MQKCIFARTYVQEGGIETGHGFFYCSPENIQLKSLRWSLTVDLYQLAILPIRQFQLEMNWQLILFSKIVKSIQMIKQNTAHAVSCLRCRMEYINRNCLKLHHWDVALGNQWLHTTKGTRLSVLLLVSVFSKSLLLPFVCSYLMSFSFLPQGMWIKNFIVKNHFYIFHDTSQHLLCLPTHPVFPPSDSWLFYCLALFPALVAIAPSARSNWLVLSASLASCTITFTLSGCFWFNSEAEGCPVWIAPSSGSSTKQRALLILWSTLPGLRRWSFSKADRALALQDGLFHQ